MKERLKLLLLERATNKAASLGMRLTNDTEDSLRKLIDIAVDRMSYGEASSVVENTRALLNTDILIERLANNSRTGGQLDYKSFNSVRDAICPLWPFC
ncbi:hypothetical protein [uncultured Chryseobacterium sp.]|uniref:hypothetical protein n=1 Tax=uncultured Chryseobacterium sp. TaxID=259322 RepID=UPI0025E46245|nr:hypothetical protein [uncultured Chryseobacterium sp.]